MLAEPRCYARNCRHFGGVEQTDGTEQSERVVCPAFPNGIPDRIAYGDDLHETVAEDQTGVTVFEEDVDGVGDL